MSASVLRFGAFELHPTQRLLLRAGEPQPLRARAFDLLLALAERAGALVGKAELMDLVWPGLVVEEGNIAVQLSGLRKLLGGDVIATVPGRGYRFTAALERVPGGLPAVPGVPAGQSTAAPAAVATVTAPLPGPVTAGLLGRDDDLARLRATATPGSCATLVGPGGVGKTALARAFAAGWSAGPVTWVDLAALDDDSQVMPALCRSLALSHVPVGPAALQAALAGALAAPGTLLVLDNAEHVIDAAAVAVAALHQAAPALVLVATSQLPLRVAAETVLHLDPLALPAADMPADQAMAQAAVALLLQRVHAADHRWTPDLAALPQLRRLCELLDGLPLALEMAAARVPLLGLQGVIDALEQHVPLPLRGARDAPARHRTLQAALAWSHDLLAPGEQRLFRRLAVFSSGFSLDGAVAVGALEGDAELADRWLVIDTLAALVERSLVAVQPGEPPRYRMLETMRRLALQRLADSGEHAVVRHQQVRALTAALQQNRGTDAPPEALAELANVPEALVWARTHAPQAAVELTLAAAAAATWTPWLGTAPDWLAACEPLLADIPLPLQARWWTEMARFQTFVRGPRAVEAARRACALQRQLGDDDGLFWATVPLLRSRQLDAAEFADCEAEAQTLLARHPEWPPRYGIVLVGSLAMEYRRRGDFDTALKHQRQEVDRATAAGLGPMAANARSNLAATLVGLKRYADALDVVTKLIDEAASAPPTPVGAHNRLQRMYALVGMRRLDEARMHATDTLAWTQRFGVPDGMDMLALLAAERGRAVAAAMLIGHSHHRLRQRGGEVAQEDHAPWRAALQRAADTLNETQLQAALAAGAALDADAATRLALSDDEAAEAQAVQTPGA